ncbi:MAG: transposase domain-containing protein, partial [Hyphomicrobium sp.]|nr:transposase domain-containing protein [Hyphomicrobium sp.]
MGAHPGNVVHKERRSRGLRTDPHAWLTDTLARIANHKINRIDQLLP